MTVGVRRATGHEANACAWYGSALRTRAVERETGRTGCLATSAHTGRGLVPLTAGVPLSGIV
jgi:hypothetical protein